MIVRFIRHAEPSAETALLDVNVRHIKIKNNMLNSISRKIRLWVQ